MTRIEHTNLIIDDFSLAKRETNRQYAHILTHIHTDHLNGLHDGWNYGPIYCTEPTKALLLHKFPNLQNIITLGLQIPTEIKMSFTLSVTVTFFDANHCIGGVMVLIEGYMGTVLYTGDMRFDKEIFKNYTYLYPPQKMNDRFERCSKQIDVLYLDNTFLKKKFDFPPKTTVLKMAVDFIQQLLDLNKHSRVFIGLDSFGKEEVLVELATHFGMYIVVDEQRYEMLRQTPLDIDDFSTSKSDGVVQVVRKNELYSYLKGVKGSMGLILSGWVNHPTYRFNQTIYCLPYSLHSNYQEIHAFVNSIRPSFIYPIVHQFPDENKLFYAPGKEISKRDLMFNQNLFQQESGNYNNQIEQLRIKYASPPTPEYNTLITSIEMQKKIEQQLRPPNFANIFTSEKVSPIHMQVVERKKYKLANNRNEMEINRLKNQIKLKKRLIEGEPIEVIEDQLNEMSMEEISKRKNEVIAVDELDIEDIKDDVVEVDPLFEPIIPKKNIFGNREKKKGRNMFSAHHDYGKQYETKTLQNLRNKWKEVQHKNQTIDNYFNKVNKPVYHNVDQEDCLIVEKQTNQLMDIQKPLNMRKTTKENGFKIENGLLGINFQHLEEIKVLKRKQDIISYLKQSPAEQQFIKKLFKRQQQSIK